MTEYLKEDLMKPAKELLKAYIKSNFPYKKREDSRKDPRKRSKKEKGSTPVRMLKIYDSKSFGEPEASSSLNLKSSMDQCPDHHAAAPTVVVARLKRPRCPDDNTFANDTQILDLDGVTNIASSKPAFYLPPNKGSRNQHELMQNPNLCAMDTKVVEAYLLSDEETSGRRSTLIFSRSSIKLEGSSYVDYELKSFRYEWNLCDIVSIISLWCESAKSVTVGLHLKSKNAKATEANNENSGTNLWMFVLIDPEWLEKQEAIMKLDVRYKDIWKVRDNVEKEHDVLKSSFIYPSAQDRDAILINQSDVDLLQPEKFINDVIIDFYALHLQNKMTSLKKDKVHIFNSFFYQRLIQPSRTGGADDFKQIHRWAAKVDLFGKDFIFIPVSESKHWSLIVICHLGKVATYKENSFPVPCILHMNSISKSHYCVENHIRSFLIKEWKERQKKATEDVEKKFLNLPFVKLEVPQQDNGYDCGLFLLHYMELFLKQFPVHYNPNRKAGPTGFFGSNWFSTKDVAGKRECIKRLIYDIITKDKN